LSADALPANLSPLIFGCAGPTLSAAEKKAFAETRPLGFILFQRNCVDEGQLAALVEDLRACVGWRAPVLIDNEGGRVQRTKPPVWPAFPAMRYFGDLYDTDKELAARELQDNIAALMDVQTACGIDVDCIPCLDVVPLDAATQAIGDRSFGWDAQKVAPLGLIAARTAAASGVTPVMKHMPGHGRAQMDSHYDLPVIDELLESDLMPFRHVALNMDAQLWGMTAHIVFPKLDDKPATLSSKIVGTVIRGRIGFDGVLLSDDLYMKALDRYGDLPARVRLCLEAGIDLALHCFGEPDDFYKAAEAAGPMRADTKKRLGAWLAVRP